MRTILINLLFLTSLLVTGCSVYKVDVQQGNVLDEEDLGLHTAAIPACLKEGAWPVIGSYCPELADMKIHVRADGRPVRYLPPTVWYQDGESPEPVAAIIFRGPIRSFNLPTRIPSKPIIKKAREEAPDITALVQPNSKAKGLKKTP